jgi:GNAT superfamily N-acetyltransferase
MNLSQRAYTTFHRRVWVYRNRGRGECCLSKGASFGPISIEDRKSYEEHRGGPCREIMEMRLRRGDECFGIWRNGEIVHSAWVATGWGWSEYLNRGIEMESNEAYIFDTFTSPAWRGHGLAAQKYGMLLDHLGGRGVDGVVSIVAVENLASIKATERAGGVVLGRYVGWRFGLWDRVQAEPRGNEALPRLLPKAEVLARLAARHGDNRTSP